MDIGKNKMKIVEVSSLKSVPQNTFVLTFENALEALRIVQFIKENLLIDDELREEFEEDETSGLVE